MASRGGGLINSHDSRFRSRMSLYKSAKLSVLAMARRSGLASRVRDSRWRSQRLLILAYHGISLADEHEWSPSLYMPPELFRQRLMALREGGYHVLPFDVAVQELYAGTLPPRTVAITFDDGAHDFATLAVPILREFNMPATVYLTTYYAERGGPVFDTMSNYLLWRGRGRVISGAGITSHGRNLDLRTRSGVSRAAVDVYNFSREHDLSSDDKDIVLRQIALRCAVNFEELVAKRLFQLMTPDEIGTLPRDLIDVQLHTHRHRVPVDRVLFTREIIDNRLSLERMGAGRAGEKVHFCYPSGVTNPVFLPWLRDVAVESATTCFVGLASREDDPLMLPRLVDTAGLTSLEFDGWLTGVSEFIPKRRGTAGPG